MTAKDLTPVEILGFCNMILLFDLTRLSTILLDLGLIQILPLLQVLRGQAALWVIQYTDRDSALR